MNTKKKTGFSLIEVNMAIFVMATGILSIAVLYTMGLRESVQSQSDFKQVMFADYVLNIAMSAACSTNVSWLEWQEWANTWNMAGTGSNGETENMNSLQSVPRFIRDSLRPAIDRYASGSGMSSHTLDQTYAVYCMLVPSFSDQIMGIMMRSLDGETGHMTQDEKRRRLESQPLYYAEARFQGKFP